MRLHAGLEPGSLCMCGLWYSQGVWTSLAEESPLLPTTGTTLCLQSLGGLRLTLCSCFWSCSALLWVFELLWVIQRILVLGGV